LPPVERNEVIQFHADLAAFRDLLPIGAGSKALFFKRFLTDLVSTKASFFSGRTNAAAVIKPVNGRRKTKLCPSWFEKARRERHYDK